MNLPPEVHQEGTSLVCRCGARAEPVDRNRFLKRHPVKCQRRSQEQAERLAFTRKIAQGTRHLDDLETNR